MTSTNGGRLSMGLTACLLVGVAGCGNKPPATSTTTEESAVTAAITISGRVATAAGLAIVGIGVQLNGSKQATSVTDANGAYQFAGLAPGSYSVRPNSAPCSFTPDVVNLNNLTTSVTQNFVGAGAGCPVGRVDAGAGDARNDDGGAGNVTCQFAGSDVGDSLRFSTRLACAVPAPPAAAICDIPCVPLGFNDDLEFVSGGTVDTMTVTNGGATLATLVSTTTEAGMIRLVADFFPPFQGIRHAQANSSDGVTFIAVIDGRTTLPFSATAAPSSIRFVDGRPAPTLTIDPSLSLSLTALFDQVAREEPACVESSTGGAGAIQPQQVAAAHGSDTVHTVGCQQCRGKCHAAHGSCFGFAAAGCLNVVSAIFGLVTGGLAPLACFAAAEAACFVTWSACLFACQTEGTSRLGTLFFQGCCPVNCGGANRIIFSTPVNGQVGCCLSGETCLNSSTHQCCSAGTTTCGNTCCGSGEVCLSRTTSTCCPPNLIRGGECCNSGTCTTDADCGGESFCDANGCCIPG